MQKIRKFHCGVFYFTLTLNELNWPVEPPKKAKRLKFEGLFFPAKTGADQLCSYCTADMRL